MLLLLLLFSHYVVSDSLLPHELQHTRLSCSSPYSGVCSNTCPLSQWCHPTISSYPSFSSCPQSLPASGSFPMSRLFTSGGQSIVVSALASVLPVNIQGWFSLGLTGLTSLLSKGLSSLLQFESINSSVLSLPYRPALISIHDYWKNHNLDPYQGPSDVSALQYTV